MVEALFLLAFIVGGFWFVATYRERLQIQREYAKMLEFQKRLRMSKGRR
jgi:hypothetical protein